MTELGEQLELRNCLRRLGLRAEVIVVWECDEKRRKNIEKALMETRAGRTRSRERPRPRCIVLKKDLREKELKGDEYVARAKFRRFEPHI